MNRKKMTDADRLAAENLRKIYADKKDELALTQELLALKCGWKGQSAVNQFMNGRVPINPQACLKLAKALRCHPAEIRPDIAKLLPPSKIENEFSTDALRVAVAVQAVPADIRPEVADALVLILNAKMINVMHRAA